MMFQFVISLTALATVVSQTCPASSLRLSSGDPLHDPFFSAAAVKAINWSALKVDIATMLTDSQDWWPADFGNYGPLMIRLAWHCSGSYRTSDGRGGCDGARQRFEPERSWEDNTNLDKARKLLWPINKKYGKGLSWGDLIIYSANVAIESMGGPVLGFCAGRIDDIDGTDSLELGPTIEQEIDFPCKVQGKCPAPLGSNTVGLIYVNPEGPLGEPIPRDSALDIRGVFTRMSMNDTETVALIGGGHAFGKAHGPCPNGPGPSPKEDSFNPWPGKCGSGKGNDTFTSGFEGSWTTEPTKWGNFYFQSLLKSEFEWSVHTGPGGHNQWQAVTSPGVMMLTSDVALMHDPTNSYPDIVTLFANDINQLNIAFSNAWYKLTTRDMGPVSRCLGPNIPPPQPFQYPLLPTNNNKSKKQPNFNDVKKALQKIITTSDLSAFVIELAYSCASTYRRTDYLGGCNGARIRHSPEINRVINKPFLGILDLLQPVKTQFGDSLSWSDLIVFAGTVAVADQLKHKKIISKLKFCPGRVDAIDGKGSEFLTQFKRFNASNHDVRASIKLSGMSVTETVALAGRSRSDSYMAILGYSGTWVNTTATTAAAAGNKGGKKGVSGSDSDYKISNSYFTTLLSNQWYARTKDELVCGNQCKMEYLNTRSHTVVSSATPAPSSSLPVYMTAIDMVIASEGDLLHIAQQYATDSTMFEEDFVNAWMKLMNIDRFDGPADNLCTNGAVKLISVV